MILRTGIIFLLFTLCLSGCSATKPMVWKAQDVSFTNFNAFEIRPVSNVTGTSVKKETLSLLTEYLKEQFKAQNLQLIDAPQTKSGVLRVQSDITFYGQKMVSYSTVNARPQYIVQCQLRTRLVDKSTTHVVARILTNTEIGVARNERGVTNVGGLMNVDIGGTSGYGYDKWVMKKAAEAVAKEVAKVMQPRESEPSSSILQ